MVTRGAVFLMAMHLPYSTWRRTWYPQTVVWGMEDHHEDMVTWMAACILCCSSMVCTIYVAAHLSNTPSPAPSPDPTPFRPPYPDLQSCCCRRSSSLRCCPRLQQATLEEHYAEDVSFTDGAITLHTRDDLVKLLTGLTTLADIKPDIIDISVGPTK